MVKECVLFAGLFLVLLNPVFSGDLSIALDSDSGKYVFRESGVAVLAYNFSTVEPGELLSEVTEENLKYARARSDYIHPLYGPGGQLMTLDFPVDHPHHRGIYWAWPEVEFEGELGDLHALQKVFARPTGEPETMVTPEFAQLKARNRWLWEDRTPIVEETVVIRVYPVSSEGRFIDLEFHFKALVDSVTVARRGTDQYGGLNVRLNEVTDQVIQFHTDSEDAAPRMAWAELSGIFKGGTSKLALSIFQKESNPDYPGDWVEYPELNWFQPTFPAAGTRFPLKKEAATVLGYRLWIHPEVTEADQRSVWSVYNKQGLMLQD
ncbi:MAG: PmoA family protein [Acidobacteriota bacterium]|nr:MAG: PmoA family protein [Acidobacteriota bacterium]